MTLYGLFETYSDMDGEKHEYCHGVFSSEAQAFSRFRMPHMTGTARMWKN